MKPTHVFQAEQAVAGYDNEMIIQGVSLVIPSNQISVIIGANACGKSTLLKSMARLIKLHLEISHSMGSPLGKFPQNSWLVC